MKPYRGKIKEWCFWNGTVFGTAVDHPQFAGDGIHTSRVIDYDCESGLIETRNSLYFLALDERGEV
jgi:hypothetical protein